LLASRIVNEGQLCVRVCARAADHDKFINAV